jgi:arylsulfatase A-like enzyme
MRSYRRSLAVLTLAAASAVVGCRRGLPPSPAGPVVIYVVDALRPDRMSLFGASRPTTPAAVALAREAVTYTNAFAVSTWTRPSVATLLTSLLPSRAAALNRWGRLDESVWYLPEALRRQGWTTAAFLGNGNLFDDRLGFDRGTSVFRAIVHAPTGEWHPTAREVVDPVLKFIEAQSSPRFFLYIHVVDPHAPYLLEPSYQSLFAEGAEPEGRVPLDYDRSARQADDQFQRIADALRAKGFWAASTIVYTADHGEEFQEHGGSAHGFSVYEEQLRIPLVVKYPQGEDGGARRPDPVSLADLTPTVAELAGLPASPEWIGSSLWRRRQPPGRDLYFTEDLDANRLYGLRRGPLKLVVRLYPTFSRTLYSLDRDPKEQAGLDLSCGAAAPAHSALVEALAVWRQRDVARFPSLRFESGSAQGRCRATIDLSEIRKPFLTAEDYCRWSREIDGERLVFRERPASPPERLYVSGDDHGRPPRVAFAPGERACSVVSVKQKLLEGPTSEDHLQKLRSLGYLQGS